jgi:hypothetical protein
MNFRAPAPECDIRHVEKVSRINFLLTRGPLPKGQALPRLTAKAEEYIKVYLEAFGRLLRASQKLNEPCMGPNNTTFVALPFVSIRVHSWFFA